MGALISGPLSALGSCLGSALGGCIAAGCCKLAGSGTVSSEHATRCVLLWLQALAALLAWTTSVTPGKWLPWSCDKLSTVGLGDRGICACNGEDRLACWSEQLVYRTEASVAVVFAALLLMALSGCAQGAARSHSVAKFMLVVLFGLISLFLPNTAFSTFGTVATSASVVFLVAQTVLLIDLAYTWNEHWYANALQARQREISHAGEKRWLGAIIASSMLLLLGSVAACIYLCVTTEDITGRVVNVGAMVLSGILLVVSIQEWCSHGALLTSAVVMAYSMWLVLEALAVLPAHGGPRSPTWVGLVVCSISLVSFARGSGITAFSSSNVGQTGLGGAALVTLESGSAGATGADADPSEASSSADAAHVDPKGFAVQCALHAAAALYIAASLAPKEGRVTFASHVAAVFLSLTLYGWSLVAPKLLTNRDFS